MNTYFILHESYGLVVIGIFFQGSTQSNYIKLYSLHIFRYTLIDQYSQYAYGFNKL